MGRKKGKNAAKLAVERRDAFNMKMKSGMTFADIGKAIGVSEATAFRHYYFILKQTQNLTKAEADVEVTKHEERLEYLLSKLTPILVDHKSRGYLKAIQEARMLSESLRKLKGINAAERLDVTTDGEPLCGIMNVNLDIMRTKMKKDD